MPALLFEKRGHFACWEVSQTLYEKQKIIERSIA